MRESLCACDEENKNPISVSSETQISSCLHFVGKMSEYSKKQVFCDISVKMWKEVKTFLMKVKRKNVGFC